MDTEGLPDSVWLTIPVREPPFEPEPETLRSPVGVAAPDTETLAVPLPDLEPLPVIDAEPLSDTGLKEAEAEGDTDTETEPDAEGCGEAETVFEGKEAVASVEKERPPVRETDPDFVIVCVKLCVQVKKSVAVEEGVGPTERVTVGLAERDTMVFEPVLVIVPVLLTLALAEIVAVGSTLGLPTLVTDPVALVGIDLLGFTVADTDTEPVDVLEAEAEPLRLRVATGLRDWTEAEGETVPD